MIPAFIALQKAWIYVKKYWYVFTIIISCIVLFVLVRDTSVLDKLWNLLDNNNKRHADELAAVKKAYEDELAKKDASQKRLEEVLSKIEKQYQDSQKQLDVTKRAEIKQIIEETSNDPNLLAQKLSESTGFKIVLPDPES